jgi:hypothetical protein
MVDAALEANKRLVVRFYDELWSKDSRGGTLLLRIHVSEG